MGDIYGHERGWYGRNPYLPVGCRENENPNTASTYDAKRGGRCEFQHLDITDICIASFQTYDIASNNHVCCSTGDEKTDFDILAIYESQAACGTNVRYLVRHQGLADDLQTRRNVGMVPGCRAQSRLDKRAVRHYACHVPTITTLV